jgi:hypothetical protein
LHQEFETCALSGFLSCFGGFELATLLAFFLAQGFGGLGFDCFVGGEEGVVEP